MSGFSFGAPAASTSNSGGGLFGSAPKPAGSTFGGFTTPNPQQSQPNAGGSLFGSNPTAPSSGLFGNTGTNTAAPSSGLFNFGASQPSQQQGQQQGQQQQQQQSSTGGLFGQAPATGQSTGGGLFGSTNNAQSSGGGLFGQQSQNQNQNQNQAKPGGLFGNTSTPGGGLFGSTSQAPSGGGLFGSTNQPAQSSGGGLFGASQPQQQQSNSLFGSTNQQPSTGGMFGSTAQPPQGQGGLFGSTTQQPSLFGQSTSQPQQQGLFASSSSAPNLSASLIAPKQDVPVEERMMQIQRAWDVNNPECRFKYFFYNVVEPGTTSRYGRPAGATDEGLWVKALRENPDPNTLVASSPREIADCRMVPVLATGWSDLQKRVSMQEQVAAIHQEKIKEITAALGQLTRQTSLSSSIRLTALQTSLATLLTRLIHLAGLTPALIPSLQSNWKPEEADTKSTLEGVKAELDGKKHRNTSAGVGLGTPRRGQAEGRMIGQVNELWGQVEEVRRWKHKRAGSSGEGWMGDERALGEVADILAQQQIALQKLTELVNNALFDADVIRQGLGSYSGER